MFLALSIIPGTCSNTFVNKICILVASFYHSRHNIHAPNVYLLVMAINFNVTMSKLCALFIMIFIFYTSGSECIPNFMSILAKYFYILWKVTVLQPFAEKSGELSKTAILVAVYEESYSNLV